MPVPELVVLGPYDLGVDFVHPDVRDAETETQQQRRRTGRDTLFFRQCYKTNKQTDPKTNDF